MSKQDKIQSSTVIKMRFKRQANTWAIAQKEKPNKRNPPRAGYAAKPPFSC